MKYNENMPEENKIELYHHNSIDEIMGRPPVNVVRLGSGIILVIIIGLFSASALFRYPDVIKTQGVIMGETPLAVLTAPETGWIENEDIPALIRVNKGYPIISLIDRKSNSRSVITTPYGGIAEINPLINIRKAVERNDTIGFIWDDKWASLLCVMTLSTVEIKDVKKGDEVRIWIERHGTEQGGIINTHVKLIDNFNSGDMYHVISEIPKDAFISEHSRIMMNRNISVSAEIITADKSLFNQLINPFRGLLNE